MRRFLIYFFLIFLSIFSATALADHSKSVAILVYHNFDPVKPGSMTISTARFEEQLKWIHDNGYTVIPLQEFVKYLQGKNIALPAKSVVITIDDGRESVYTYALPIIEHFHIPVTLFIYTSVISHEKYALTWEQLKALQKTGLFSVESHTVWHPNFKQEKKRLSECAYEKFITEQLVNSKNILEKKLGTPITLLAWPFGIYNHDVEVEAEKAGYHMAFSIAALRASRAHTAMAQPRYMIIASQDMKIFALIVRGRHL